MSYLRLTIRLLLLSAHVLLGALLCVTCLPHQNNATLTVRQHRIIQWWLATCCRLIGLRVRAQGQVSIRNGYYVSNHVSWMDIIVIGSLHPVRFLSKAEVAKWPFIGYLARCAGTIFIRRGDGARAAFKVIETHLRSGENIAIFPEGTTGATYAIRRFHPRLFGAAIDAKVKAQPIAIGYPLDMAPNPLIPFRENQSFMRNVIQILKQPRVDTVVRYAPAVSADDRRTFAEDARALVMQETETIYAS